MPPFPPQGAIYLTLLSRHSLGNGTMVMLVLLSLRWGMKAVDKRHIQIDGSSKVVRQTGDPR
ncbi:MAG: hypothetical protein WBI82_06025 [Sphaerochaeta sp.]